MVKPIATTIDELLARYDKKDDVVAISSNKATASNDPEDCLSQQNIDLLLS